jgi:glutamate-5-semialdehyde dehydrogenase
MNEILLTAYKGFLKLKTITGADRSSLVLAIADSIHWQKEQILEANTLDLEVTRENEVAEKIIEWIRLTPERLDHAVEILEQVAISSDPHSHIINPVYQLGATQSYAELTPLGVIAFIHEGFPELAAIAAAMAVKSGNSLVIRGCGTAKHTNKAIYHAMQLALQDSPVPTGCIGFLDEEGEINCDIQELVKKDEYLSLIIPYGRPHFIREVTEFATAPVLQTTIGNCYLYWPASGNLEKVKRFTLDSHCAEPDAVNAIEKILIDSHLQESNQIRLFSYLLENNFILKGEPSLVEKFPNYLEPVTHLKEWASPYLGKVVAFKSVDNLHSAIQWINIHSSGHADCIVTDSYEEGRRFSMEVDSAIIYLNCSPRFQRYSTEQKSVFLGASNQRGVRRGLIGLHSFTTPKQIVQGT